MQSITPLTMKAAIATGFGGIDENIHVREDWPVPCLDNFGQGFLLVRILACVLAPGDVRLLSGKTDYVQLPASGHPYVVGSDSSGIVVACHAKETKFQIGDYVVSRFDEPQPVGGLAEYRIVKTCLTEKCPSCISPVVSCGLPASSQAAKILVRDYVKHGDRVLVIGGSGAVGTSVLQYAKLSGAAEVVAVSTQADLCKFLGATRVIDYRKQRWWQMEEYHKNKFDVVIDLVNGDNWVEGGCAGTAIDPKGTYVALLSGVDTELEVHGILDMVWFSFELIGRLFWSRLHPSAPRWVAPEGLKLKEGDLDALFHDVVQGKLTPILDPFSPFSFAENDVRKAFHLQKSRHAHGKVVIQIAEK